MQTKLNGKVVLITGASGGIGLKIAEMFLLEGAIVAAQFRTKSKPISDLQKKFPERVIPFRADLRSEPQTKKLFLSIQNRVGPVEIFIANAGIYTAKDISIAEMKLAQWYETLRSNLTSVFLCFRKFLIGVKKYKVESPSAAIIGSTAGVFGEAMHADYAASKSALIYGFLKTV